LSQDTDGGHTAGASALPARIGLATEQMLEHSEVPAHGIHVAQKRCQVLLRCIEVASQRRHGIDDGPYLID
jgi:hypothetical protein